MDYSHLVSRKFKSLEFEEQAWIRQLMRQGLVKINNEGKIEICQMN